MYISRKIKWKKSSIYWSSGRVFDLCVCQEKLFWCLVLVLISYVSCQREGVWTARGVWVVPYDTRPISWHGMCTDPFKSVFVQLGGRAEPDGDWWTQYGFSDGPLELPLWVLGQIVLPYLVEKVQRKLHCMLTHRCPGLLSPMIVDCILTEGSFSSIFIFSLYMLLILPLISI